MAKYDELNSQIGEGSAFEGKFYIHGSLKIDGKFEGEIRTEGQLIIGETGRVKTNISARRVTVGGTVIGNIDAGEEVHLLPTGRVLGNIRTPQMKMEPGVVTMGKVILTGGQKKDIQKIIEDSFSGGPSLPDAKGRRGAQGDKPPPADN